MNPEKLRRLQEKVRTGGKGSMRRKHKVAHKQTVTDDKKLQQTLKRLGLQTLAGIDEVNLFKNDDTVIRFTNPKLQAAVQANTYVVSGNAQTKTITELMPDILSQLGQEKVQQLMARAGGAGGMGGGMGGRSGGMAGGSGMSGAGLGGDDESVPDLVDTDFEKTAAAGKKAAPSKVDEQD